MGNVLSSQHPCAMIDNISDECEATASFYSTKLREKHDSPGARVPLRELHQVFLAVAGEHQGSGLIYHRKFWAPHEALQSLACLTVVGQERREVELCVALTGAVAAHPRH